MAKVYALKHATPKMKYQHMNMVLDWRADLKEKQMQEAAHPTPKPVCVICGGEIESQPMKPDTCYDCYRTITAGIRFAECEPNPIISGGEVLYIAPVAGSEEIPF